MKEIDRRELLADTLAKRSYIQARISAGRPSDHVERRADPNIPEPRIGTTIRPGDQSKLIFRVADDSPGTVGCHIRRHTAM